MKITTVLIVLFCFVGGLSFAQTADSLTQESTYQKPVQVVKQEKKNTSGQKVFYGGSLGLSFGSYTSIRINPMIGYQITSKLSAGFKFLYEYSNDHTSNVSNKSFHNYGASVFGRYRFIPQAYIHAEYSFVNYQAYGYDNTYRYAVPYLLLGGGYIQKIGPHTSLYAEILFDVLNDSNSPYAQWNPFYSFGFSFGI